jgi:protein-S-isoprenylcysteine O-methyltransferase Ste14
MKDRLGLAFFTFAATISALAAWEHPALLAGLAAFHNAVLAILYARRKPALKYDLPGLGLGLLAAVLPLATSYPVDMPLPFIFTGLLGYALIFWSLLSLRKCFGIAPADRGLIVHGPYRLVRHPMYLGELVLRAALVAASPQTLIAIGLLITLAAIQVLRAQREERIISGYPAYANKVHYRLVPGVW